jgi:hypothetical protein
LLYHYWYRPGEESAARPRKLSRRANTGSAGYFSNAPDQAEGSGNLSNRYSGNTTA